MVKPVTYPTFKLIERRKAEIRAIYQANLIKKGARGHWAKVYSTSRTTLADLIETDEAGNFKADVSKDKEMLTPEFLAVLGTRSPDQVAVYVKSTFDKETPCSPLKRTGGYLRHRKSQVNKAGTGAGDQGAIGDDSDDESYRGGPAGLPLSRINRSARKRRTIHMEVDAPAAENVQVAEEAHAVGNAHVVKDTEGPMHECIDLTSDPEENINDVQGGDGSLIPKLERALALGTEDLDAILAICNLSMYRESFLSVDAREPHDLLILRDLADDGIDRTLEKIRRNSRAGGRAGVGYVHLQKFIEVLKAWNFNR